jgi:hypothetical protein
MKYTLALATLLATACGGARAQTPANPEKTTQTTYQKAATGIPYADQTNYMTMTYDQVPQEVQLSFGNAYPNAANTRWESNKMGYRTSFEQDGRKMSIWYDLQGKEQERRTGVAMEALPLPVQNQLKGQEANLPYEIKVGNETYYSAEVGGKEVYYNAKGKAIRKPKKK